ncbi:MAG TPA: flagellar export protein FliJ [Thermoguttaceae bacterium]|nr:flagellar export protein FliJ [Thermoguttaceae bacterium]
MAKFKFRLATLLRLREAARDQRREELAEAYRADDLLREQLARTEEEIGWLRNQCRRVAAPGTINVDQLVEAQRYEVVLKVRQKQLQGQREQIGAEIERRRQALVVANRNVRVLEKLREHQARRHRETENRQEIKQLDEAAGLLAAREDVW